ncbi:MAG: hypothetical protein QW756_08810 [Nitrososphaerota archaeon]
MRFGLIVGSIAVLLVFSTYMTLATSGLIKVWGDVVRMESIIPYDSMSADQIVAEFADLLGDRIVEKSSVIRLQGCVIDYYTTEKGNRVQVGLCRGEFRFLSYANLAKSPIYVLSRNIPASVEYLLKKLSGLAHLETDFMVEQSSGEGGFRTIRGFQTYAGQRILASGYSVEWNDFEEIPTSIIIFDVYILPPIQPPLPQPKLDQLMSMVRERGFTGFTYRTPVVQGLKACDDRITYSLRVVSEQSPLHGYEALVDAYTGEVLLMIGLSALGVYRVWESVC